MKKVAFILSLLCAIQLSAQVSVLDPTFGNGGAIDIVFIETPTNFAIQPSSGKILIAGTTDSIAVSNGGYLTNGVTATILRLNNNGTLDNTFDNNGYLAYDFDTLLFPNTTVRYQSRSVSISSQNDGKILLHFRIFLNSVTEYYYTARFYENGILDTSFAQNGLLLTGPYNKFYELANGQQLYINKNSIKLFSASGQPEIGFGNNGAVVVDSVENIISVKEVNGGYGIIAESTTSNISLLHRFNISNAGIVSVINTTLIYSSAASFINCAIDNNNATYLAGYISNNSVEQYGSIVKLRPDFTVDTDFALYGRLKDSTYSKYANIFFDPDGKLLIAGAHKTDSLNLSISKLNPNGTFDNNFGNNGCIESTETITYSDPFDNNIRLPQSERQTDGKIISCIKTPLGLHLERFSLSAVNAVKEHAGQLLNMYPNPATAGSVVKLATQANVAAVSVFDMQGRMVSSCPNKTITAPTAPGVYIIQILTDNGISSQKLVVE